jgi:hypothetical protein
MIFNRMEKKKKKKATKLKMRRAAGVRVAASATLTPMQPTSKLIVLLFEIKCSGTIIAFIYFISLPK